MSKADDFTAWCGGNGSGAGVTFVRDASGRVRSVKKRVPAALKPVYTALMRLDSPCLPHITNIEELEGALELTEDYIPGRTLRQLLQENGPLADGALCAAARDLAGALCLLQAQRPPIIHRDIKPENIILSDA